MKKIKKLLCLAFAIILLVSTNISVLAKESNLLQPKEIHIQLENNIALIEKELEAKGTSVEQELKNALIWLETEKACCTEITEIQKLQALIDTTQLLLEDYRNYTYNANTRGVEHPVFTPAVAAVATYFSANGYRLAFELLTHAQDNNILDSKYVPHFGSRIKDSPVVRKLVGQGSLNGDAKFPNEGNVLEKDLYYAIHKFNYTFNPSTRIFSLSDRYDFAYGDYSGIAGAAIDTMYLAQLNGVLVPFYTTINEKF